MQLGCQGGSSLINCCFNSILLKFGFPFLYSPEAKGYFMYIDIQFMTIWMVLIKRFLGGIESCLKEKS